MSKTETTSNTQNTSTSQMPGMPQMPQMPGMPNPGDYFAHFADQYAQLEAQMMQRARQAIEAWSQLAHDALAYSAQLSVQARKMGLDAAKKMQTGTHS